MLRDVEVVVGFGYTTDFQTNNPKFLNNLPMYLLVKWWGLFFLKALCLCLIMWILIDCYVWFDLTSHSKDTYFNIFFYDKRVLCLCGLFSVAHVLHLYWMVYRFHIFLLWFLECVHFLWSLVLQKSGFIDSLWWVPWAKKMHMEFIACNLWSHQKYENDLYIVHLLLLLSKVADE